MPEFDIEKLGITMGQLVAEYRGACAWLAPLPQAAALVLDPRELLFGAYGLMGRLTTIVALNVLLRNIRRGIGRTSTP